MKTWFKELMGQISFWLNKRTERKLAVQAQKIVDVVNEIKAKERKVGHINNENESNMNDIHIGGLYMKLENDKAKYDTMEANLYGRGFIKNPIHRAMFTIIGKTILVVLNVALIAIIAWIAGQVILGGMALLLIASNLTFSLVSAATLIGVLVGIFFLLGAFAGLFVMGMATTMSLVNMIMNIINNDILVKTFIGKPVVNKPRLAPVFNQTAA